MLQLGIHIDATGKGYVAVFVDFPNGFGGGDLTLKYDEDRLKVPGDPIKGPEWPQGLCSLETTPLPYGEARVTASLSGSQMFDPWAGCWLCFPVERKANAPTGPAYVTVVVQDLAQTYSPSGVFEGDMMTPYDLGELPTIWVQ